jgi:hypothetical protein
MMEEGAARPRFRPLIAALVLGGVAIAGAITALWLRPASETQEVSPVPPPTAPSLGAPGVSAAPEELEPAPPVATTTVDLAQLPTEEVPEGVEAPAAPQQNQRRVVAPAPKPKEPAAAGKPSPAPAPAPTKPAWKNDPGF